MLLPHFKKFHSFQMSRAKTNVKKKKKNVLKFKGIQLKIQINRKLSGFKINISSIVTLL